MAENTEVIGGLPTTNEAPQNPLESPEIAEKPAQTPYMDPVQKARMEYETQRKALLDQQQKLIESLSVRSPSQDFFRIAQAALSPTRSGSASEGFGRIAGAMAEGESADTKRNQDLAKMRYELAQQQLGMSKEGIDMARLMQKESALRGMAGQPSDQPVSQFGQPSGTASGATSGKPSATAGSPQAQAQTTFQSLPRDIQAIVQSMEPDKAFEFLTKIAAENLKPSDKVKEALWYIGQMESTAGRDYAKNLLLNNFFFGDQKSQTDQIVSIRKAVRAGEMSNADANALISRINRSINPQYGNAPAPVSTSLAAPSQAPLGAPSISGTPTSGARPPTIDRMNPSPSTLQPQVNQPPISQAPRVNAPTTPNVPLSSTPPSAMSPEQAGSLESKVTEETIKQRNAEFAEQRKSFQSWTPIETSKNVRDLKSVYDTAKNNPQIFGLLKNLPAGYLTGMAQAAQEGLTLGEYRASFPVETFLQGVKLSPEEKTKLKKAENILATQFFANARDAKSAIGPSVSNADVRLMQGLTAQGTDPARFIQYWALQNVLNNNMRAELNQSFNQYESRLPRGASLGAYFTDPKSPYQNIVKKYDGLSTQLGKKFPDL
jgi:hypothetical protein